MSCSILFVMCVLGTDSMRVPRPASAASRPCERLGTSPRESHGRLPLVAGRGTRESCIDGAIAFAADAAPTNSNRLPAAAELPQQPSLPDPLVAFDGTKISTREEWLTRRRPELKTLFQHYMYGYFPPPPANVKGTVDHEDRQYLNGKATRKLVTIRFGPAEAPPIQLLVVLPNDRQGPAPVFVGLNFCGNHALLDDPLVPLPTVWMRNTCPGCVDGRATAAGRGSQKDVWGFEQAVDRGYAIATCYCGDIDPDKNDFSDGVHPWFGEKRGSTRGPHDWGTIAAWAWGVHRCVDYLVTDSDLDKSRIAVVGHSRLGKTALVAAAFDERIALAIPHQAGTGGTSPSRKTGTAVAKAESVKRINTSFPHWFCDKFKQFNEQVDRLPFDQHCLVALCAPRPVLLSNAVEDVWADPEGQFRMLQAAEPVYRLMGAEGLADGSMPEPGRLVSSTLGYYIREGKHSMTLEDWKVFLDFADRHLRRPTGDR